MEPDERVSQVSNVPPSRVAGGLRGIIRSAGADVILARALVEALGSRDIIRSDGADAILARAIVESLGSRDIIRSDRADAILNGHQVGLRYLRLWNGHQVGLRYL